MLWSSVIMVVSKLAEQGTLCYRHFLTEIMESLSHEHYPLGKSNLWSFLSPPLQHLLIPALLNLKSPSKHLKPCSHPDCWNDSNLRGRKKPTYAYTPNSGKKKKKIKIGKQKAGCFLFSSSDNFSELVCTASPQTSKWVVNYAAVSDTNSQLNLAAGKRSI